MSSTKKIRLSSIAGSDRMMDVIGTNYLLDTPINKYKIKCDVCKFPDIDTILSPYYLAKNRVFSGIEITEADLGNLLVSDRVKQIFEILVPSSCIFKKTYIQGTSISTGWWLAAPKNTIVSGNVKSKVVRCKKCNEPLHAHPGSQYKFWIMDFEGHSDIIKSKNWHSIDEQDWKKSWIGRDIFLSVRLISLLKTVSAKGVYQDPYSKYGTLTKAEKKWVKDSVTQLGSLALVKRKNTTTDDVIKLMTFLKLKNIDIEKTRRFEKKFKMKPSELAKAICSHKGNIKINIGSGQFCKIANLKDWQPLKSRKNLIHFAFDEFGNSLLMDAKHRLCPLYYYDHETMAYELIYSSILDITN